MNNRRHNSDEGHSPTHHLLTRSFRRDGIGRTTELTIALYGATTTTTSTDASRRSVWEHQHNSHQEPPHPQYRIWQRYHHHERRRWAFEPNTIFHNGYDLRYYILGNTFFANTTLFLGEEPEEDPGTVIHQVRTLRRQSSTIADDPRRRFGLEDKVRLSWRPQIHSRLVFSVLWSCTTSIVRAALFRSRFWIRIICRQNVCYLPTRQRSHNAPWMLSMALQAPLYWHHPLSSSTTSLTHNATI